MDESKLSKYLGESRVDEKKRKGVPGKNAVDKIENAAKMEVELNKSDFKWLSSRLKNLNSIVDSLNRAIQAQNSHDLLADAAQLSKFLDGMLLDGIENMLEKKKVK